MAVTAGVGPQSCRARSCANLRACATAVSVPGAQLSLGKGRVSACRRWRFAGGVLARDAFAGAGKRHAAGYEDHSEGEEREVPSDARAAALRDRAPAARRGLRGRLDAASVDSAARARAARQARAAARRARSVPRAHQRSRTGASPGRTAAPRALFRADARACAPARQRSGGPAPAPRRRAGFGRLVPNRASCCRACVDGPLPARARSRRRFGNARSLLAVLPCGSARATRSSARRAPRPGSTSCACAPARARSRSSCSPCPSRARPRASRWCCCGPGRERPPRGRGALHAR